MGNPVIVTIIGLPGAGKTTVSRVAARAFAAHGMKTASLDIDRFAKQYLASVKNDIAGRRTRELIQEALLALRDRMARIMNPGESAAIHPYTVEAVKAWIHEQSVDVIFLEMHWAKALIHYPSHELWIVTAPSEKCLRQFARSYHEPFEKRSLSQEMFARAQFYWSNDLRSLPREKHLISNTAYGLNAIRYRIQKLVATIAICYEDGRYENEDDIPPIPPSAN